MATLHHATAATTHGRNLNGVTFHVSRQAVSSSRAGVNPGVRGAVYHVGSSCESSRKAST